MGNDQGLWIVCLTLFIVIGVNALIYVSLRGKKTAGLAETLRHVTRQVRNPWEMEDRAIGELSRLVEGLRVEGRKDHHDQTEGEKSEEIFE